MAQLGGFTEEDKKKVVEFLNMVAKHATFNIKTNELIDYFKLLAHMQQQILPKIEQHILEVVRVVEEDKSSKKKSKGKK